jgi:dienelactone hydrolase
MTKFLSKLALAAMLTSIAWAKPFYNTTEKSCEIPLTEQVMPLNGKSNDFSKIVSVNKQSTINIHKVDDSMFSLGTMKSLLGVGPEAGLISDFKITDTIPGSGPYAPVGIFTENSLPGHTIYAPRVIPTGTKIPVIVWGEGGCINIGDQFQLFLREVASHGYLIIASGAPTLGTKAGTKSAVDSLISIYDNGLFTTPYQLTQSIDWVMRGGADKYGEIQKHRIAAAGQSCGGLEAYVAAVNDDRIKAIGIFNSGLLFKSSKCLLKNLKVPVGYFLGGPKDLASRFVRSFQMSLIFTCFTDTSTGNKGLS